MYVCIYIYIHIYIISFLEVRASTLRHWSKWSESLRPRGSKKA